MTFDKSVVVPLDPDATFALITQPDRLRRWMTVAARVDLRAGGDYRWTVTPGHHAAGTIVDVDPGKRVMFTWGWEEDADPPPGASTVTVTLTPVDGGTEVRLVHDGLTDEQAARHAEGWNHFLGRLVAAGRDGDAGPDEWAAAPDPLDELSCAEATLAVLQDVLRGLDSSDLTKQTPCTEYNVAQLADHLMTGMTRIGAAAGAQMPQRDQDAPLETQVADAAEAALEAWRRRGLEGTVELASTQVPATAAVGILSVEFLVHAWDFAMATDRHVVVSEPVCDYVQGLAGKIITPQLRAAEIRGPCRDRGRRRQSSIGSSRSPAGNRPLSKHPPTNERSVMPKKTEYEQGTPSWVDLQTTDQAAGKEFYASLLGWSYDDRPMPQGGTYSMALLNGETVAAIAPMPPGAPEGMPPMWNTYIAVDDIDATVEKVAPAGGQVFMPPMAVGDAGTMAFVADPTGAVVGLWQANQHIGATLVNEPGALIWNELITDKPESALAFYEAVLGVSSGDHGDGSGADVPLAQGRGDGSRWLHGAADARVCRTTGMCTSRCRTPTPLRRRQALQAGRSPWSRSTSQRSDDPRS